MNSSFKKTLFVVSLFAIAMGLLESAVVIYLRDILYPGGFEFPLNPVRPDLVWTEILREAATLVMLLGVGILAGRNLAERFAWFLYTFAVWDIFYYFFLWVLVGWPTSLMTWDVLFLLPVTWTGPVITPLIVSATMMLFALLIVSASRSDRKSLPGKVRSMPAVDKIRVLPGNSAEAPVTVPRLSWLFLIVGSIILIIAFTWDYSGFILERLSIRDIWTLPQSQVHAMVHQYIPRRFNWMLFSFGELAILSGILIFWRRIRLSDPA